MAATQPELTSQLLSGIKEVLACATIGTVVSTCVYGITILQAYIYFRWSVQRSTRMNSFIAILFILDTISAVLTIWGLYAFVVTDFGNPSSVLVIPPVFALEDGVSALIGTLAQLFFAQRLWALSKQNKTLVSSVVMLALCSCVSGIIVAVHIYTKSDVYSIGSIEIRALTGVTAGTSMICDIAIVVALCYYLRSKRTGFKRTDSIIGRLVMYAVNRGVLTATCAAGKMISTVALPGRFVFVPFTLLLGRLYCNTLFATLNAQQSMRGDDNNIVEFGTDVLHNMNVFTPGTGNSRRGAAEHLEQASNNTPTFVLDISRVSSGKTMKDVPPPSSVGLDA